MHSVSRIQDEQKDKKDAMEYSSWQKQQSAKAFADEQRVYIMRAPSTNSCH